MVAFIDGHRDRFGVEAICRTLGATECGFITSHGYPAVKTRPTSDKAVEDELLVPEFRRIHAEDYGVYGVRKMHHAMARAGWEIGWNQTGRLMRVAGLQGVRRGRTPVTTKSGGVPDSRPDLVERKFIDERPHRLWVADVTHVRTLAGFCYVAFITDVNTRRIVGWAVSASLHTAGPPLPPLEHALLSTQVSPGRKGLVHRSGRGSQYVGLAYSDALITAGESCAVGTVGDSCDIALAETVNGLYKVRAHPLQTNLGVRRGGRVGHDGMGALVEHAASPRSPGLSRSRGGRRRLDSRQGLSARCVLAPERNPGRFRPPLADPVPEPVVCDL